jgi:putative ABC transport system permease protein
VGATRWQIIRLLAIESAGLTLTVVAILVFAARWFFPLIFEIITQNEAVRYQSFMDWSTLGSIGLLSVVAGLAAVIVPTLRLLKADLNPALKESGGGMGESRRLGRIRNFLVVLQAAFAVILLAGTGLMVRSFEKLQHVDLGFDPIGRVKVQITIPKSYALTPEARFQLFENLRECLKKLPGVKAASCGQDALLSGFFSGTAQVRMPDGQFRPCAGTGVAADFLEVSGLILKRGQWVSGKRGSFAVVINEALAKALFGDADPTGKSIRLQESGNKEIPVLGVVGNVRETVRMAPGFRFYAPTWRYPPNIDSALLRLDKDPGPEFGGLVSHAIYAFDPKLIVTSVASIDEVVLNSMYAERYAFRIMRGLTAIALIMVVVGLFSVISYTVASRRQEFGVRTALGATPMDLHRLVLKRALVNAGLGVVLGTAIALGVTRFMQSLLFETTPNDPLVYAAVAVVMLLAAVLACWLPARRAAKADPIVALRAE